MLTVWTCSCAGSKSIHTLGTAMCPFCGERQDYDEDIPLATHPCPLCIETETCEGHLTLREDASSSLT